VIAGLLTSTVLTLIVLPTAYATLESATAAVRSRGSGAAGKVAEAERG
jgi:hypothetical protein